MVEEVIILIVFQAIFWVFLISYAIYRKTKSRNQLVKVTFSDTETLPAYEPFIILVENNSILPDYRSLRTSTSSVAGSPAPSYITRIEHM
jgi:hypothetical protein